MTKTMQKAALALATAVCLLFFFQFNAHAASGRVSFNDPSVTVGNTVTVTMTARCDEGLGALDATLTYDTSMLEYVSGSGPSGMGVSGGSGSVRISWYDTSGTGTSSVTCTLTFRALKAGSTVIKPSSVEVVTVDETYVSLTSSGSSTVTINAAKTASTEARLSSLQIAPGTLSPSFSSDVYEYTTTVSNDTTKLVLSLSTKDSNATYSISGTSLSVGSNTTTIKVTAEDGSTTKTYYIYTTRQAATSDGSDNSDDTDAEEEAEETTEETAEETTEETEETVVTTPAVTVDGQQLLVALSLEGISLPDGFEVASYTYEDTEIAVAVGVTKPLTLFWLTDESGENGAFYVYDEDNDTFYLMVDITSDQKIYTIVPLEDETLLPDGYVETTVDIAGQTVTAWETESEEDADFVLVYAMNWDGDVSFYRYDTVEETMQRYVQDTLTVVEVDTEEVDALTETVAQQENQIDELEGDLQQAEQMCLLFAIVAAAEAAIVILILVVLAVRHKMAAKQGKRQK